MRSASRVSTTRRASALGRVSRAPREFSAARNYRYRRPGGGGQDQQHRVARRFSSIRTAFSLMGLMVMAMLFREVFGEVGTDPPRFAGARRPACPHGTQWPTDIAGRGGRS
jgi:hypothetical protein